MKITTILRPLLMILLVTATGLATACAPLKASNRPSTLESSSEAFAMDGGHHASAERIAALIAEFDSENTPGGAILVMRDNAVIYTRSFGMANLEHHALSRTPGTGYRAEQLFGISRNDSAASRRNHVR